MNKQINGYIRPAIHVSNVTAVTDNFTQFPSIESLNMSHPNQPFPVRSLLSACVHTYTGRQFI